MPSYRTPSFRYGQKVECLARGEVEIVGLTDAPVPWPIGKTLRAKSLVLYRDLAQAVRRESNLEVCRLFGVTPQTVSKWRKVLGVEQINPGTLRLRVAHGRSLAGRVGLEAMWAKARDPGRRRKILQQLGAASPGPAHVIEAMRQANLGRPPAHRAKIGKAHKRRGTIPPIAAQRIANRAKSIERGQSRN